MTQSSSQPVSDASTAQPSSQSVSSPLLTQSSSQPVSDRSKLDALWKDFHPLSSYVDRYIFHHWYIFTVGFYIAVLIFDILHDIDTYGMNIYYFFTKVDYIYYGFAVFSHNWTGFDITYWTTISLVGALILTAIAFNAWMSRVRMMFQELPEKGRISSKENDLDHAYYCFLRAYQSSLKSNKKYILSGIAMMLTLFFVLLLPPHPFVDTYLFQNDFLYHIDWLIVRFLYIAFPLFWAYCFGIGAWAMGVSGLYLKRMSSKFNFNVQPSHPDNCGGLKLLGDFCFGMALPILIGSTLLGVYSIGAALDSAYILSFAANVGLILFALPLAYIALFVPLWNVHQEMVSKRRAYEDEFSDRVTKLEDKVRSFLDKEEVNSAKSAKEEIEIIQVLHPKSIGYPTWPFDSRILLRFLAPQIVTVLSLLVQLGPVVAVLQHIFHPGQ